MYEDIREQFKSVIRYSQNIPDPQVDYLFKEWEIAKERFIKRFGGLIYEWPIPVEFTLDDTQKRARAMEFATTVSDTFNNPTLAEFIDENLDTFFDNKVSKSLGEKIPEGMKLLKAFKFFEPNKAALRNIQDMASQIIQENKIKGTLCFSVHPLDFLSSSENTYNWRSCHALDGEYRAGNLSYMIDKATFMVYLKGADSQHLYGFGGIQWNSKKWRMLIHSNETDDIMFAGRQYPFSSKNGIDTVLNIYNNLIANDEHKNPFGPVKFGEWRADYVDSYVPFDATDLDNAKKLATKYLIYANQLVELGQVVKDSPNTLNYNDILRSTCYHYPYYTVFNPWGYHSVRYLLTHPVVIGAEVPCLHCGQEMIENPETMRCDDCELTYGTEENDVYGSCDCCGARIYIDDAICVGDDNDIVCDSCYQNHCFVCEECGQVYYEEQKVFVPDQNNEDEGCYVCRRCFEDMS